MNEYSVAGLDDWCELKQFWGEFKESKYASRIDCSLYELQQYFLYGQLNGNKIGIILGRVDGQLKGVFVLQEVSQPIPESNGLYATNCFIVGVYIDPKVSREFSDGFLATALAWAKARNHRQILGNVRLGYKFRAVLERYGFSQHHVVIGRFVDTA